MLERGDTVARRRVSRCNQGHQFCLCEGLIGSWRLVEITPRSRSPQGLVFLRLEFLLTLLPRSFLGSYEIYKLQPLDIKANVSFLPLRLGFQFGFRSSVRTYLE